MKGNPHCPACAGTGRTYSQRPQDHEPEWRDCDMLPLPGGEPVNAAVAEDLRRMAEDIALAQPEDELVEIIAAQMWLDTFGPDSRRDWRVCVREAEEYGPESAAAMQIYQWRVRAKRFADAIRPLLADAAPAPSRPADRASLAQSHYELLRECQTEFKALGCKGLVETIEAQCQRHLALRDAPRDAGDGWRPIETAPKDGSSFLACHSGSGVRQITWQGKASHVPMYGWAHGDDVEEIDLWSPTHWRPLPAPPSPNAGDETQDRQGGGR